MYGEGVVKIWTTFGTTLKFWKPKLNLQPLTNSIVLKKKFNKVKELFR